MTKDVEALIRELAPVLERVIRERVAAEIARERELLDAKLEVVRVRVAALESVRAER